ncbi:hypothetical protein VD659_03145 [Herbiconiux sp. 11R-BC]|uniref:hypothetical protein n=1 Tax=Herbiconiux sp. 11R-BC TaxID=3111637 RepID=UPI003C03E3BF
MTDTTARRRPGLVTLAVVLIYIAGIADIALGVLTIFLRYLPETASAGLTLPITLLGAATILFGLFLVALASGVARGSRASRLGTTIVLLAGLALDLADLAIGGDGDWSGVVTQLIACVLVIVPLWVGPGRRYFAPAAPTSR